MKVDEAFVNLHFESVPGVGTFAAGGFAGGNAEHLCGHADGTLHLQVLFARSLDQVTADLFEGLDVARCEGDSDAVRGGILGVRVRLFLVCGGHVVCVA